MHFSLNLNFNNRAYRYQLIKLNDCAPIQDNLISSEDVNIPMLPSNTGTILIRTQSSQLLETPTVISPETQISISDYTRRHRFREPAPFAIARNLLQAAAPLSSTGKFLERLERGVTKGSMLGHCRKLKLPPPPNTQRPFPNKGTRGIRHPFNKIGNLFE